MSSDPSFARSWVYGPRSGILILNKGGGGVMPWYLSGGITLAQCVAAYQPKGAADFATSKINLNSPGTHNLTDGAAAPTWASATGWSFVTASSQYLVSDITPPDGTYSYIIQYSNASSNPGRLFGMLAVTAGQLYIQPNQGGVNVQYQNGSGAANSAAGTQPTGNAAIANLACYRNGVADGSIGSGAYSGAMRAIWIGGQNNGGTGASFITGDILSFAVYNITLSAAQVAAVAAAMAAL